MLGGMVWILQGGLGSGAWTEGGFVVKWFNLIVAMSGKKDGVLGLNPGVLLLVCAAVAVVFASVPWGGWFERMWEAHIDVHAGGFVLDMSVRHWVNDALMAVFFFVVGLEIKREMLFGQLSSLKKSALPVFAAVGGDAGAGVGVFGV